MKETAIVFLRPTLQARITLADGNGCAFPPTQFTNTRPTYFLRCRHCMVALLYTNGSSRKPSKPVQMCAYDRRLLQPIEKLIPIVDGSKLRTTKIHCLRVVMSAGSGVNQSLERVAFESRKNVHVRNMLPRAANRNNRFRGKRLTSLVPSSAKVGGGFISSEREME